MQETSAAGPEGGHDFRGRIPGASAVRHTSMAVDLHAGVMPECDVPVQLGAGLWMPNVAVQRRAAFGASVATACWATCEDQGLIFTSLGPITRSATSVSKAAWARSQ